MKELNYNVGGCFTLKDGSVWRIVDIEEEELDDYPIKAKFIIGENLEDYLLSDDGIEAFTKKLELFSEEDWYYDKNSSEEDRNLLTFDKFIQEEDYPEYFI